MPSRIIDSDQLEIVREPGYEAEGYLAVVANTVIFQAEVASIPTGDDFGQIAFTTVTTGAYTDVREGMLLLISTTTTNYRLSVEHYRVRKPPTSGILYVNEMSIDLAPGDILTVINTYEPMEKLRRLTFVDWDLPFEDLAPVITNMDSAYAIITTDSSGTLTFSPVGVAMAEGDSVDSDGYAWEFDGTTTIYNIGDATTREIEVELSADTEWGRLTVTTVNGISTWFAFSIHIGHPTTDARFILCHDPVDIEASTDGGYNATTTAYKNITLTTVMDRTRCVVIVDERYGGGVDPELGNVRFIGYLVKDSNSTRGDEKYGVSQSTQIEIHGFKALAGELPMFPIAVRDTTTPAAWDEMDNPTTERTISHVLTRHSTLANLCAIDFGPTFTTTPNKWFAGNPDVVDTSLMDACKTAGSEINGELISNAAGGFVFERHGSFLDTAERNALPTVIPDDMNSGDQFQLDLVREHKPRVGKVEMGARVFFANGAPSIGYTAMAPAVAIGEGQERVSIPNALLPADDASTAAVSASQRAAYWYAFKNNLLSLSTTLTDGWGWISPSTAQWWPFDIAATDTTRGVTITSATRWLLVSVRTRINANGTQDVSPVWQPETTPGRALILVAISPSVALTELPVLPNRSAYGPFPPAPSINYDTTAPTKKQRRDPFSGWQTTPWPTKEAAQAAQNQANPNESKAYTNFRYNDNIAMGFTTVLGAPYLLTVSGSAKVVDGIGIHLVPYSFGLQSDIHYLSSNGDGDLYRIVARTAGSYDSLWNVVDRDGGHFTVTEMSMASGTWLYSDANLEGGGFVDSDSHTGGVISDLVNYPTPFVIMGATTSYLGATLIRVKTTSLTPLGDVTYGDAFYIWNKDSDGNPTNVQLNPGGLRLDNAAVAVVPPFNPNSIYAGIPFTGTGNPINFKYLDTDSYDDNQSAPLWLAAEGEGAGS